MFGNLEYKERTTNILDLKRSSVDVLKPDEQNHDIALRDSFHFMK